MALTRDAVIWGFRLVLGRDPEDERGIEAHMRLANETALVEALLRSQEFRASGRFADVMRLHEGSTRERPSAWGHDSRSRLRVAVFGNCQAAGIAQLLQAMTGDVVAKPYETTPGFLNKLRGGEFDIDAVVTSADLVLVQMVGEITQLITQRLPRHAGKVRQLPPLNYAGFHPDCIYVGSEGGGHVQGPMGEYQSSIAFWAWSTGLHWEQALELFTPEVFGHLGFGDYHVAAEKVLVSHGRLCKLPMAPLIDSWRQAGGCFMHTINHPKRDALAAVVAAVLRREGIRPIDQAGEWVDDHLARWPVWPVYPGLDGASGDGYVFKLDRGFCPVSQPVLTMDLAGFVQASYKVFAAQAQGMRAERIQTDPYQQLARFVRDRPSRWARIAGALGDKLTPMLARTGPAEPHANSPYLGLPDHRFWRRSVERIPGAALDPVVRTSFTLDHNTKVATAGSCFAQHIARTLQREKFNYLVADTVKGMDPDEARRRGFGMYSARYGNLYTARQLVQLFDRAHGSFEPLDRAWAREDGRFVDPFRPQIEPEGFATGAEVEVARQSHLADVRKLFASLDVFVFTLGLTEGWRRKEDGAVFPLAPGVAGGLFTPERYEFVNFDAGQVLADMHGFLRRLRTVNDRARLIVTVSPVPLIATYEEQHVLVSTVHSKSVLRAAAGALAREGSGVDYFPSYEIITGVPSRGQYFGPDLRSVTEDGVAHVMRVFLRHYAGIEPANGDALTDAVAPGGGNALRSEARTSPALAAIEREQRALDQIVCDEEAIDRHRAG